MRFVSMIATVALVASSNAIAQTSESMASESTESEAPTLALSHLIDRALATHPSLTALDHERRARLAMSEAAGAFPDPMLSFAYTDAPLSLSFTEEMMTMAEGMVSQTFPWFGKRELRRRGPAILAEAASRDRDARGLELAAQVTEAYAQLWLAVESRRILTKQKAALENSARLARARFATMAASKSDPLRAELELTRLVEAFLEAEESEAAARARLASLLSERPQALAGEPAELPEIRIPESLDALTDTVSQHPSLLALDVRRDERENAAKLASKESAPDITVGLMYGHRRIDRDLVGVEVSLPIPIFGKSKADREAEAAMAEASAFDARRTEQRNELLASIRAAHAAALSRQRLIQRYEEALLPLARENVQVASASYRAGTVDVAMLIDAQVLQFGQELAWARSRAAYLAAVGRLEAALGERRFTKVGLPPS